MRLVLASDIHYGNLAELEGDGPFSLEEHVKFAAQMHAEKPDVLVVAGDCAETGINDLLMSDFLSLYKNPHGHSVCIPGNHDCWISQQASVSTADEKYEWFYKRCDAADWIGLRDKPFQAKNGVWIAGNCGWYDFSTIDPEFMRGGREPRDAKWYERFRDWSDYGWMRLDRMQTKDKTPMLTFCKKRMEELSRAINQVPPPAERKYLAVVTHIVGFERLQAWFRRPDEYRAYMGNTSIGKLVMDAEADLYYCGHTHRRVEAQIGKTRCINNGSGYGRGSKRYDVIDIPD